MINDNCNSLLHFHKCIFHYIYGYQVRTRRYLQRQQKQLGDGDMKDNESFIYAKMKDELTAKRCIYVMEMSNGVQDVFSP